MVTSLPSHYFRLTLSLSLSPNVPHAQYRKRFRASYNTSWAKLRKGCTVHGMIDSQVGTWKDNASAAPRRFVTLTSTVESCHLVTVFPFATKSALTSPVEWHISPGTCFPGNEVLAMSLHSRVASNVVWRASSDRGADGRKSLTPWRPETRGW